MHSAQESDRIPPDFAIARTQMLALLVDLAL
jgi:hypothetical protein